MQLSIFDPGETTRVLGTWSGWKILKHVAWTIFNLLYLIHGKNFDSLLPHFNVFVRRIEASQTTFLGNLQSKNIVRFLEQLWSFGAFVFELSYVHVNLFFFKGTTKA